MNELQNKGYIVSIFGLPVVVTTPIRVKCGKKNEPPKCSLCGVCAENDDTHPIIECQENQIFNLKRENKNLNNSVNFWKDAWYEGRSIIGKLQLFFKDTF